jgi:hypothetical protein
MLATNLDAGVLDHMSRTKVSVIRSLGLASVLAVVQALTTTAVASNTKAYDRGCADAKAGSYDRSKHNDAYEKGWQACKQQQSAAPSVGKEYDRGCADAKVGSYDRSKHSDAYEQGWQACKKQAGQTAAAPGTPSKQEQACLAAVSRKSNNGDVTVLNSEFSQANTVVMIGVGAQRAPWRCLVSNSGVVEEVMFAGSEGRL